MRLSKIGSIFSTLVRISLRKRASPGTVHLQAGFSNAIERGLKETKWKTKSEKKCSVH